MTHLESIVQDIRFAVRALRRTPGVAITAVATLALGIGAATVVYSVLYSLLIAPVPYRDVDRSVVVSLRGVTDVGGWKGRAFFSTDEYRALRASRALEDLIGARTGTVLVHEEGRSTRLVRGAHVTPNAFEFLGVPPLAGRWLVEADGRADAAPVFVVNHRVWQAEFGGDPAVVGQTFVLDGRPRTLVGIMPPRFHPYEADVWMPLAGGDSPVLAITGRLRRGVTVAAAAAELDAILQGLARDNPGGNYPAQFVTVVRPYLDTVVGGFRRTLLGLLAAVALLLAIAASNVANLLLARATAREREIVVRAALGASRARLLRQLVIECLVLAAAAAALGSAVAYLGLQGVVALIPAGAVPPETSFRLSAPVLLVAVATAVVTALLCGLAAALRLLDDTFSLRDAGVHAAAGPRQWRLRSGLVVAQVALSVVLLVGAGVLGRSFLALTRVDLGFDPRNVLVVRPWLPPEYDSADRKNAFSRALLDRLSALPGVVSAAQSMLVPPLTHDWSDTIIPGRPHAERWETRFELCSEDYFRTLGLRLVRGALFTAADVQARRHVVVVNETFVNRYLAGENPLGQQVRFQVLDRPFLDAPHDAYFEIVGVVADHLTWAGEWQTAPQAFLPYSIQGFSWRTFLARTRVPPESLHRAVRDAVWAVDPRAGISAAGSIEQSLRDFYRDPQFDLVALGAFAAIGLALVAAGVFSVMAFVVSTRTREIGVRVAMGAMRRQIAAMVLGSGLRLVAAGYLIGLGATYVLSSLLAAWIPGIGTADPVLLALVGGVVAAAGIAASAVPALRAAQVDPMVALRAE